MLHLLLSFKSDPTLLIITSKMIYFANFLSFSSCFWFIFILATFSFYTYNNIFLQAEIGFKLPAVNLVSALNNFDTFVTVPYTERFDLYVNLAKTFDAYKTDYLQHYNDYLLLLNTYLVLDESQIGLKYYAYKHYLNKSYKEDDTFVLKSPLVEFSQNFYSSEANGTDRELNLMNKHYHPFSFKNNKLKSEKFFNNYIFPLYNSQSSWRELEVATSMAKILNHWTLIRRLQIGIFCCSLIMNAVATLIFFINRSSNKTLFKPNYVFPFLSLFLLTYVIVLIMICTSLFVKIVEYNLNMNFEGLHNITFIAFELAWILLIGYFSICWFANFKSSRHQHQIMEKEDSLQAHLAELFDSHSEKNGAINNAKDYESPKNTMTEIFGPFIQKVKRIITPTVTQSQTNQNNNDTHAVSVEKTLEPTKIKEPSQETSDTQKLFSKNAFEGLQALNLVSALSVSHTNVFPYSEMEHNLECGSAVSSVKLTTTDNLSTVPLIERSKVGSISQSLEEKRIGFYQHRGTTTQLKYNVSGSTNFSEKPAPNTETSLKSDLPKEQSVKEQLLFPFEDKPCTSNDFEWETKFGLKSSRSGLSLPNQKVKEDNSSEENKQSHNHTIEKQYTSESKSPRKTNLLDPKKLNTYFISSASIPSESTVDTDNSIQQSSISKTNLPLSLTVKTPTTSKHRKSV